MSKCGNFDAINIWICIRQYQSIFMVSNTCLTGIFEQTKKYSFEAHTDIVVIEPSVVSSLVDL